MLSTGASGKHSNNSSTSSSSNTANNRMNTVKVIFFLHIPFPTSQIFRTLTKANELLQAMTCADVLGFHAFDHARHFLTAAKRMQGVKSVTRPGRPPLSAIVSPAAVEPA